MIVTTTYSRLFCLSCPSSFGHSNPEFLRQLSFLKASPLSSATSRRQISSVLLEVERQNFLLHTEAIQMSPNQGIMALQVLGIDTFLTVSQQTEMMEQKLEYVGLWRQVGDRQGRCLWLVAVAAFSQHQCHIPMWPGQVWFCCLTLDVGVLPWLWILLHLKISCLVCVALGSVTSV